MAVTKYPPLNVSTLFVVLSEHPSPIALVATALSNFVAGDPALFPSSHQPSLNGNIDLGALYQQTVESRVTRTFSQHWIIVGKVLRVLLLDFDAKFTLLIPNIELGKAFRINKVRTLLRKN